MSYESHSKSVYRISVSTILLLPICLQIWNTYTKLLGYAGLIRWFTVAVLILRLFTGKNVILTKSDFTIERKLWLVCIIYLWAGVFYSVNSDATILYCTSITTASIIVFERFGLKFFGKLISMLYALLIFSAFTIYLNSIIHNLMTVRLSFIVADAARAILESDVRAGIYSGIYIDRANAAFGMNVGFAISYCKYIFSSKKINLWLSVLFFGAIFFTGKRTLAVIPIILVFSSMFFKSKDKRQKRIYMVAISGCIVALIIIAVLPSTLNFFVRRGGVNTWSSRSETLWPVALSMFNTNKLFGTGLNTFNTLINGANSSNATLSVWSYQAHNIYIQLLGETGLIGALLIGTFFIINIKKANQFLKGTDNIILQYYTMLSLFIQIMWLVYGLTGNTFYYSAQLLFYLVSICILEACLYEEKKNRSVDISPGYKLRSGFTGIRTCKGASEKRI